MTTKTMPTPAERPPVGETPQRPGARRFTLRGKGLAIRFALTALLVLAIVLLFDAFVGIGASDPWAFLIVAPLGIILSFIVAGWVTALLFYDPDVHEP